MNVELQRVSFLFKGLRFEKLRSKLAFFNPSNLEVNLLTVSTIAWGTEHYCLSNVALPSLIDVKRNIRVGYSFLSLTIC